LWLNFYKREKVKVYVKGETGKVKGENKLNVKGETGKVKREGETGKVKREGETGMRNGKKCKGETGVRCKAKREKAKRQEVKAFIFVY